MLVLQIVCQKASLCRCCVDFELSKYTHRSGRVVLWHPLVLRENTRLSSMVVRPVCLPTVPAKGSLFSILTRVCYWFLNDNHAVWDDLKNLCCFHMNFPDA